MSNYPSTVSTHFGTSLTALSTFGELEFPTGNADMTFQLDIIPTQSPDELWFGIVNIPNHSDETATGFAIRIDLVRGEIWDAQNGFGLLGHIEKDLLWLAQMEQNDPLLLCFKLEKRGQNILPTLQIAGSNFLYPSVYVSNLGSHCLTAVAGAVQPSHDKGPFCYYPAFWLTHSQS